MTPNKQLTDSLLAGLAQDSANPDAEDDRFLKQAMAITDEDAVIAGDPEAAEDDDEGGITPEAAKNTKGWEESKRPRNHGKFNC